MKASKIARYALLIMLTLFFLLPFYVMFRNAFSTQKHIASPNWHWLPDQLDFTNLKSLLANDTIGIGSAMLNSAVTASLQTIITVLVSLMAGYALARWKHRLASFLLGLTVFTLMVPATMTFVPTFIMTAQFGWIDTYRGLVIPAAFSAFATYLFRQFFLDFPEELEDAARVDGCTPWGVFWRVVVPNSKEIIAAVGTIVLLGAWNAFLWPSLVGRDNTRTVQVALSQFMTSQGVRLPELFMGSIIAILPMLVMFLFLQRYLVRGFTTSGLR